MFQDHRQSHMGKREPLRALNINWDIRHQFGSCAFVAFTYSQHINISIAHSHNICGIHFNEP